MKKLMLLVVLAGMIIVCVGGGCTNRQALATKYIHTIKTMIDPTWSMTDKAGWDSSLVAYYMNFNSTLPLALPVLLQPKLSSNSVNYLNPEFMNWPHPDQKRWQGCKKLGIPYDGKSPLGSGGHFVVLVD